MLQPDHILDFVEAHSGIFREQNGTSLRQAWGLYRVYIDQTNRRPRTRNQFCEDLKSFFDEYHERAVVEGVETRNVYAVFNFPVNTQEGL